MTDAETGLRKNADPLERFLIVVGTVPMAIEPYLPMALRRNFGVRLFVLAGISIVLAPGMAVLLFSDVFISALFIGTVVAATGFLGYCEMYRAL
jgi:methyl-accepting chemotaxis protein